MAGLKPYHKYMESGIDWIREVPEHWQIKKLKRFAKICNGQDQKEIADENGIYPIIGTGGAFGKTNKFLYDKPSVILGRKGTIDKPQFITEPFWSVDTAYYTMINDNTHPLFFYYSCLTIDFNKYKYGSAVPSMTQETLNQIELCCPPLSEQELIANFITVKITEINTAITKKQQLIQLLNEEKEALISKAVTKGINPDVPLKETGIDWLGKIPQHWEVKRLRFLCKITTGAKNTEDKIDDGAYPFFVRSQTIERINSFSFDGEGILTAGDGVGVGKVFHYINDKFDFHQRVYLFYNFSKDMKSNFLFYYMQCNLIKELMLYNAKSTVDSVRLPVLQDFQVVVPNIEEQEKIVRHIQNGINTIVSTISKIEKEISLLKEYKASLIYEAVTGKIDVRNELIN